MRKTEIGPASFNYLMIQNELAAASGCVKVVNVMLT